MPDRNTHKHHYKSLELGHLERFADALALHVGNDVAQRGQVEGAAVAGDAAHAVSLGHQRPGLPQPPPAQLKGEAQGAPLPSSFLHPHAGRQALARARRRPY